MIAVIIAAVLVVVAIYFLFFSDRSWVSENIPAVKGGIPWVGQVLVMLKGSPWDTMAKWVLEYGTIYKFQLFGSYGVCVADPDLLKIVLQSKYNTFKKDVEWTYKPFLVLLGNGIVTAEGSEWLKQRTLLSIYLKQEILNNVPEMAMKAVVRLCAKLDKARDNSETVEMAEEFRHLTLQVISETILSLTPEESDETFAKMYLPIVEEGNLRTWHPYRMFLPTPSFFKFKKDVQKLDNYVTGLIVKRWELRQKEAGTTTRRLDVLDKLLSIFTPEEWNASAIRMVCFQIKTFVLAGHETTASMLTWTFYQLCLPENKSHLEIILRETSSVFASCRDEKGRIVSAPSLSVLTGLKYAACCLRESLRLYSPVPTVVRKASEDCKLGDYFVSKGSTIMVCIQGVHHNPQYWPEPQVYKPERFIDFDIEDKNIPPKVAPYTFIPFVEGPRNCLGQYLSLLEARIVLSVLLSTYKFELVTPQESGKKHAFMIPVIPATGHFVKVQNR